MVNAGENKIRGAMKSLIAEDILKPEIEKLGNLKTIQFVVPSFSISNKIYFRPPVLPKYPVSSQWWPFSRSPRQSAQMYG